MCTWQCFSFGLVESVEQNLKPYHNKALDHFVIYILSQIAGFALFYLLFPYTILFSFGCHLVCMYSKITIALLSTSSLPNIVISKYFFIPKANLCSRSYYYLYFTDKESEADKGYLLCPNMVAWLGHGIVVIKGQHWIIFYPHICFFFIFRIKVGYN